MRLRIFMAVCFALCLVGAAQASVGPVPVTTDLWDTNQGAVVLSDSGMYAGGQYPAVDMFGAVTNTHDVAQFKDAQPAGTWHWVEWETPQPEAIGGYNLFLRHDKLAPYNRAISGFELFYWNGGGWVLASTMQPATVPYGEGPDGNLLTFTGTFQSPITAQVWMAEFQQRGAYGPRVTELDAVAAPEPCSMLLLGSGLIGLAGFRKRFRK